MDVLWYQSLKGHYFQRKNSYLARASEEEDCQYYGTTRPFYNWCIIHDFCWPMRSSNWIKGSEYLASAQNRPNRSTLLCFSNLTGAPWDLSDCSTYHDINEWAASLSLDEILGYGYVTQSTSDTGWPSRWLRYLVSWRWWLGWEISKEKGWRLRARFMSG